MAVYNTLLSDIVTISSLNTTTTYNGISQYYVLNFSSQGLSNLDELLVWLSRSQIGSTVLKLDVSFNNLTTVDSDVLALLPNLTLLDVSHNKIFNLDKDLFVNNTYLHTINVRYNSIQHLPSGLLLKTKRILRFDASHNQISHMGLALFHKGLTSMKTVNISYNSLQYFEPWPYSLYQHYHVTCTHVFDLSHNDISVFTNKMKLYVTVEQCFQVDLNYNNFKKVTPRDFKQYIPRNVTFSVYNIIPFNFRFLHNPWTCDCDLFPIVELVKNSFLFRSESLDHTIACFNPPHLRDKSFGFLVRNSELLICNVTTDCPDGCQCQDRPAKVDMGVDCSATGNWTQLPSAIPKHSNISMNMSGNIITFLQAEYYSKSIFRLDVSHNKITDIDPEFFHESAKLALLDLRDNLLTSLPKTIVQSLAFKNVNLENNPLTCSCESLWLNDWIRLDSRKHNLTSSVDDGSRKHNLTCKIGDGSVSDITAVTYSSLRCYNNIVILVCVLLGLLIMILLISVFIGYKWKNEVKVLLFHICGTRSCHKIRHKSALDYTNLTIFNHDILISSNVENAEIRAWISSKLLPRLLNLGLTTYYPPRDEPAGYNRIDLMAETVAGSQMILVILDRTYLSNGWCIEEFDHAHQHMSEDNDRKIIVLLCDDLVSDDIQQEPLKSYVSQKNYIHLNDKLLWIKVKYEISTLKYINGNK